MTTDQHPARAGIDLGWAIVNGTLLTQPRTRGDRPADHRELNRRNPVLIGIHRLGGPA